MSNTSQWIPYESVVPITLKNNQFPDFPFLSGTGFFVVFPPYNHVFLVTARHCVFDNNSISRGVIRIPWKNSEDCTEAIRFSDCLTGKTETSGEFIEDVAVFVVEEMPQDKMTYLTDRAIKLQHKDNVNFILNHICERRENLRIVGFPGCSKYIDYDDRRLTAVPRGIYGKITKESMKADGYEVSELNWKEGGLDGFSGSPVLSLHQNSSGGVTPVVVGVVITGSPERFSAVNINIATDLISCWIAYINDIDIGCPVNLMDTNIME